MDGCKLSRPDLHRDPVTTETNLLSLKLSRDGSSPFSFFWTNSTMIPFLAGVLLPSQKNNAAIQSYNNTALNNQ